MGNSKAAPEQTNIPGIAAAGAGARRKTRQKRAGKPEATPGLKATIAAFDASYRAAYSAKPTWGAKQCAMVKRLVAQHGADEVQKRIALLFAVGIDWPRPPWDVGALVAAFDRLVGVGGRADPRNRVRPSDVLGKVKP